MEGLKDLLAPKTLHWFSYVANVFWILLGIILSAIFLDIENSEPRFDFRCGSNGDKELIRGKCYEQYDKQYNKFPVYGFVIINFLVTASVCGIYSQAVKSRVEELERENNADDDVEGQTPRKKLFKAYCLQLLARFVLGISFVLLQTKLLHPLSFSSSFNCNLTRDGKFAHNKVSASVSLNVTQTQTSYECHNQQAAKKTFWANAVIVVTGTFAFLVVIESLYMLLWRARKVSGFKAFTEDQTFHKYYLSSNTSNSAPTTYTALELDPLLNNDEQTSISTFIEHMKEHVRRKTERSDRDPFCPNHGEGSQRNQTLDQIYTNLVIHEGRVDMDDLIAGENSQPTLPEDIFGAEKQKILVVGRAGIGKTMFSTKILRNWASDNLFTEAEKSPVDFKVAFLIKLRRFNSAKEDEKLSLRELLNHSEYSKEDVTEEVWKYILQNPNKVLIIFDGFDEYSGKTKIDDDSHPYRDNEQGSMPIHFLFKKIVSGDILRGATVLTTTSYVMSFMRSLHFDKTVDILGFTTEQLDEYVQKFTKGDDRKANIIKQYISSNLDLLSFCCIPVNCFIICSFLFQLFDNSNSASSGLISTTLTEVCSTAVKFFYFRHHTKEKSVGKIFLKPFKELSSSVQKVFKRLGKIAFDGIREKKQIFESPEVNNLESNGLFHRFSDTTDDPLAEGREQYRFLHPTVQKFLAAMYLVDTLSSQELGTFVSDHIHDGTWKVVMQFVAGLLAEKEGQSTDIFSNLLPSKTFTRKVKVKYNKVPVKRTKTLTGWPAPEHKLLVVTLFNCMYENKASDREVQKKLAKIGCNALNFVNCNLSPLDCLALVHALKSVEGILYFDLSVNSLQSLGCIEIAKLLPGNEHNQGFCELKTLNLGWNNITDEGVKHLSTALKHTNCKLNSLALWRNNITDESVKHLSTALTHTNCKLNCLDLEENNITDEGVNHLSTALTHTKCKLDHLNLRKNGITQKGENLLKLRNRMIHCKLVF